MSIEKVFTIRKTALLMYRLCIYHASSSRGQYSILVLSRELLFFWTLQKLDIMFWSYKPERNDFSRKNACLAFEEPGGNQKESVEAKFPANTKRITNFKFHLLVTSCSKQSISGKLFKLVCQINVFDYIKRVTDYHILIIILVTILTFTHLFYFIQ